uniref:Ig-like domain-containing protein n=1 Tax=Strigamia maritima TaxID=126957 RepID=T1JF10_STRMM
MNSETPRINKTLVADVTDKVWLEDDSNFKDRSILDGEAKQITCKANGYPTPKDFLIKKGANDEWIVIGSQPSVNVMESGTFTCETRYNDTQIESSISSKEISFRNYDKELRNMNQILHDKIENYIGSKFQEYGLMRSLQPLVNGCLMWKKLWPNCRRNGKKTKGAQQ